MKRIKGNRVSEPRRHNPKIEQLEGRILYSADALVLEALVPADSVTQTLELNLPTASPALLETSDETLEISLEDIEAELVSLSSEVSSIREVVFIDATLDNYQTLITEVSSLPHPVEIIFLDSDKSGVDTIAAALVQYHDLEAVRIYSHGSSGQLQLGSDSVTLETLANFKEKFAVFNHSLTGNGDLLIYGCEVAQGDNGQAFIQRLSEYTHADIAASTDLTGASWLGGDWELEFTTGEIEASLNVSDEFQASWKQTLEAATNLSSGIELNLDGGNDAYLLADDGSAIMGGLTQFTLETIFQTDVSHASAPLLSYAVSANSNELLLFVTNNGTLGLHVHHEVLLSSNVYPELFDGEVHHIAVSWDNTAGTTTFYIDGEVVDTHSGLSTGESVTAGGALLIGQEQDTVLGGFDSTQAFSSTLYDTRIWNDVRSAEEIELNYQHKFDTGNLPSNLIANWQMNGFSSSNEIIDVVAANNLSIGHASGSGFITSTPIISLNIDENAPAGTSVGVVIPSYAESPHNIVNDGLFLESPDPGASYITYDAVQNVGGWTVQSGSVDVVGSLFEISPLGGNSLDLDGNSPGSISQNLSTEVGKEYQVSFALSANYSGATSKSFRLSAAGETEDFSVTKPIGWSFSNLTYQHESFTFTATSTITELKFTSLQASGDGGSVIADIQVYEIPQAATAILNNDPTLSYDAITQKFYRFVNTASNFNTALSAATTDSLNGFSGQLVTIASSHENALIQDLAISNGSNIWLGASDATTAGEWNWLDGTTESTRAFWTDGENTGTSIAGQYASTMTLSNAASEHYLHVDLNGDWNDNDGSSNLAYVVEWDAAEVLNSYSFSLTDDGGGSFTIDSDSGEITLADTSLVDYETTASRDITVQITNAAGESYSEVMAIALNNQTGEPTQSLPGTQITYEDTTLIFSSGNNNAITVSDTGSNDSLLQVTLSTTNGILTLSQTTGLTFVSGSNASATMVIDGTESDLNAALEGMIFAPTASFTGSANIAVTTAQAALLEADYSFETSDAQDDSASTTYTGTLLGDAYIMTDAERGQVLSLDGTGDSVSINSMFAEPTEVTLAGWVNFNSTGRSDFISLDDRVHIALDDGTNANGVKGSIQIGASSWNDLPSGINLSGTGWHHIAYTFDDANNVHTLYIDGIAVATETITDSIYYTGATTSYLGQHPSNSTWNLDGEMDDVRIYSRALSNDEIAALATDQLSVTGNVSIAIYSINDAPTDLSSGIELNIDGGNDAYLKADDGGAILGGITQFTLEMNFQSSSSNADSPLLSYASSINSNELLLYITNTGDIELYIHNEGVVSSNAYPELFDEEIHHLAVSWDNTNGTASIYIDGQLLETFSNFSTGAILDAGGTLLIGQEQDLVEGGFSNAQVFSTTLYDTRIWNTVRSNEDIAQNYQYKFDGNNLPSGLIANWQMDGFNASNEVVDVVAANNLSIGHATGAGFITSTPITQLQINENAPAGTSVGVVIPSQPEFSQNIVNDGLFLQSPSPDVNGIYIIYSAGETFGGWTVQSGDIDVTNAYWGGSPSGGYIVDLNGLNPGAISQALNTETGKQYQVNFALTGNFLGGETIQDLRISAASESEDISIVMPAGWSSSNLLYENRSFTFTANANSTELAFTSLDVSGGGYGPMIADIQVHEIPPAVTLILNSDPTLSYDAVTKKFYRLVDSSVNFDIALAGATASSLNDISGQLLTIDSEYENALVQDFMASTSHDLWLGASDAAADGEWNWLNGSAESLKTFWSGGASVTGQYASTMNLTNTTSEYYLKMDSAGEWTDSDVNGSFAYVVEWDALEVLNNYSFALTDDDSGSFSIDSNSGEITLVDTSITNYETTASRDITVQVTNAAGQSYSEVMSIALNNQAGEPSHNLPSAQTTDEDINLIFSSGNGNAIVVSDTGSDNNLLQVTLTSSNGTLHLSQTTGLTFVSSSNNSDYIVINGMESDLNAALEGMAFSPTANFSGSANVTVTTAQAALLEANYSFDANDAQDDATGTDQTGTLMYDATVVTDAERGQVLSLDGIEDSVSINSVFDEPSQITLSTWVNFNNSGRSEFISLDSRVVLFVDEGNGGLKGTIQTGAASWNDVISNVSIANTGWRHIAYSFDDANNVHTLYIDGVEVARETITDSIYYTGATTTELGRHGDNLYFDLDGKMDDVRIYSRTLNSDEIAALATDQLSVSDSIAITVNSVNDVPTLSLTSTPSFTENGTAVVIDATVLVVDAELDVTNFAGATVTLERNGSANSHDIFSESGLLSALIEGGNLSYNSSIIGTVTTNSGGTLLLSFNSNATAAIVNMTLQSISYSNSSDAPVANVQIDWIFDDGNTGIQGSGGAKQALSTSTVSITAINDAPLISTNIGHTVIEGSADNYINTAMLNNNDPDDNSSGVTYTITSDVSHGTLFLKDSSGPPVVLITLGVNDTFTQTDIDSGKITYDHDGSEASTDSFDFTLADGGEDGSTPANGTFTITISNTNDAPVNILPPAQVSDIDTPLLLSTGAGNAIQISDVDAASSVIEATLSITNGSIILNGIAGLSFSVGDGSLDNNMTFTGTVAAINSALDGMSFVPTASFNGQATVLIQVDDLGTGGSGGSLTDSDALIIHVGGLGFQQGVNGYSDTEDTYLSNSASSTDFGSSLNVVVDGGNLLDLLFPSSSSALLQFNTLFGNGINQIPVGSTITSASLDVYVTQTDNLFNLFDNNHVRIHEMLTPWSESSTYDSLSSGVSLNDTEASTTQTANFSSLNAGQQTISSANLLTTLQGWANDPSSNHGWVFVANGADNWAFASAESSTQSQRPQLLVSYTPPAPTIITLSAGNTSFIEDGGPVAVSSDLLLSDTDSTTLTGATVTINNGFISAEDSLNFSNQNGISGNWNSTLGLLTLTGNASVSDYQSALRSVTYNNSSDTPDTSPRTVEYRVSDAYVSSAVNSQNITITSVNDAPVITSNGAGTTAALTAAENQTAVTTITSSDIELDTVTYSITGGADAALFNLNATTGVLSFNTSADFEDPSDSDANGVYLVEVSATDGNGGSDTQALSVTVDDINDAPFELSVMTWTHDISENPSTIIESLSGSQSTSALLIDGRSVSVSVSAGEIQAEIIGSHGNVVVPAFIVIDNTDSDISSLSNPVVATLANGNFMVVAKAEGYIGSGYWGTGILAVVFDADGNKITVTPERADLGPYILVADSSNNRITPTLNIAGDGTITVGWSNTSSAQFEQRQFQISGPSVAEDASDGSVITTLIGSDADANTTLSYSIVGGSSHFEIIGDELRIKAGHSIDYESATSHTLVLRVSDGSLSYDKSFTVRVSDANDAPVNTLPSLQTVNEDSTLSINGISIDDDDGNLANVQLTVTNGNLNITLQGAATVAAGVNGSSTLTLSGNGTDINATLATLSYQGNLNFNGIELLTILSSDSNGSTDSDTVAITVTPVNDAPTTTDFNAIAGINSRYVFQTDDFQFNDIDSGDSLQHIQISNISGSGNLSYNGITASNNQIISRADIDAGLLSFTPDSGASGNHYASFDFAVGDGTAYSSNVATVTIDVSGLTPFYSERLQGGGIAVDASGMRTHYEFSGGSLTPTLTVNSVPASASVVAAYLVVSELDFGAIDTTFTLNGSNVTASLIGQSADPGWLSNRAVTVAADVTALITGNGSYTLGGTSDLTSDAYSGVTLIVVYEDTSVATDSLITLNLGAVSHRFYDTNITLELNGGSAISQDFTQASLMLLGLDGQDTYYDSAIELQSSSAASPSTIIAANRFNSALGGADLVTVDITSLLSTSDSSAVLTQEGTLSAFSDFLLYPFVATVIELDNSAPALDNSGTVVLTTITEDQTNNNGNTIAEILLSAGGDRITDDDLSTEEGIAITGLNSGNGSWQFSSNNGGSWSSIGTVSNSSALLLRDIDRVRFVPNTLTATAANLTFRAWDQSAGTTGSNADTSTAGGSSAFSNTVETATITVSAINDSPLVATNTGATIAEASTGNTLSNAMLNEGDVDDTGAELTYTINSNVSNGTLRLNSVAIGLGDTFTQADINASRLSYDHNGSQTSSDSFSFSLADGGENSATAATGVFTFTITNSNDAPVITVPASVAVNEDSALTISGISIADDDGTISSVALSVNKGTLHITLAGTASIVTGANDSAALSLSGSLNDINSTLASLSYLGNSDINGSDTLTVISTDSDGASDTNSTAITLNAVNDGPDISSIASITVTEDLASAITGISVADSDAANSPVLLTLTVPQGSLTASSSALITVAGSPTALTLTGTVTDINAFIAAGSVSYTTALNANGSLALELTINDLGNSGSGGSLSSSQSIVLNITAINDAQSLDTNAALLLDEGGGAVITSTQLNTSDAEQPASSLVYNITTLPSNGTLSLNGSVLSNGDSFTQADINNGFLSYSHNDSETTSDQFSFTVGDGISASSSATFSFVMTALNDQNPSIAAAQNFTVSEKTIDGASLGFIGATDGDADSTLQNWQITGGNNDGIFDIDALSGELTIAQANLLNYELQQQHQLSVSVSDGIFTSTTEIITIDIADFDEFDISTISDSNTRDNHIAENSQPGTTVGFTAFANDSDLSATVSYSLSSDSSSHFTIHPVSGVVTLQQVLDFELASSHRIEIIATSSDGSESRRMLTIEVENLNDLPPLINDITLSLNEHTNSTTVIANLNDAYTGMDTDRDNNPINYQIVAGNDHGVFTLNSLTGEISITDQSLLNFETAATHTLTIEASDGIFSDTTSITVDVLDINDTPVITSSSQLTLTENSIDSVRVTANDEDNQTLSYSIVGGDDAGLFHIDSLSGELSFINASDFESPQDADGNGRYELTIAVTDAGASTQYQNITITVANTDEIPIAVDDHFSATEDQPLNINNVINNDLAGDGVLALNDVDSVSSQGATIHLNSDGSFTYTPAVNFNGSDSFQYSVIDESGDRAYATISVNVAAINDAPVAAADQFSLNEDSSLTLSTAELLGNDSDIEHDVLLIELVSMPLHGLLIHNTDNSFTYHPESDHHGIDFFSYRVSDGTNDSNTTTVTLSINAINDAPTSANTEITIDEDSKFALSAEHFSYHDIDSGDLQGVVIDHLPTNGSLYFQELQIMETGIYIPISNINALEFQADENENGRDYSEFAFRVFDGEAFSVNAAKITIHVTAIDDAPVVQAPTEALSNIPGKAIPILDSNNQGLTLIDLDGDGSSQQIIKIRVAEGQLSLTDIKSNIEVTGLGTTSLTLSGSSQALSEALLTLSYQPILGFSGNAILEITATDVLGDSTTQLGLSTTSTISILISDTGLSHQPTTSKDKFSLAIEKNVDAPIENIEKADIPSLFSPYYNESNRVISKDTAINGIDADYLIKRSPQAPSGVDQSIESIKDQQMLKRFDVFRHRLWDLQQHLINNDTEYSQIDFSSIEEIQFYNASLTNEQSVTTIAVVASVLTTGTAFWVLRGGSLITSLLLSYPAWRDIDPLPILSREDDEEDHDGYP